MSSSVFISYSHDSDEHRQFVRGISDRLRADGLDCQIDQYINGFPPEGWQRWMETQVEQADFVLLICTEKYLRRYRGLETDGGRGVNFEGVVISQTLYDHYYRNTKFIPVLPDNGELDHVPLPLKVFSTFTLPKQYTELYCLLTKQHATPPPEIGETIDLGFDNSSPETRPSSLPENGFKNQGKCNHVEEKSMNTTLKAAYIGAGAALLAAVIAGLFSLFTAPDNTVAGKCGSVITGSVGGNVSVNCPNGENQ